MIRSEVRSAILVWYGVFELSYGPLKELKNFSRGEFISEARVDDRLVWLL